MAREFVSGRALVCLLTFLLATAATATAPAAAPAPAKETESTETIGSLGFSNPIPDSTWERMQHRSWHAGRNCPARESLALLHVPFTDFDGQKRTGEMIVASAVAHKVLGAFAEIYKSGFKIESMQLIDIFDGDDQKSMAANNTSAFNCRRVTSGKNMSEHSTGRAIDLNPVQNPYVTRNQVTPPNGMYFFTPSQRNKNQTGLIQPDGAVVRSFTKIGWKWGGFWTSKKDYQHFSESGR